MLAFFIRRYILRNDKNYDALKKELALYKMELAKITDRNEAATIRMERISNENKANYLEFQRTINREAFDIKSMTNDAKANIAKLDSICSDVRSKMSEITVEQNQWTKFKVASLSAIRKLQEKSNGFETEIEQIRKDVYLIKAKK